MRRQASGVASALLRGALAVALGVSLILGSLILGSLGVGSSASADEPVSVSQGVVFYGYVFVEMPGALPESVRALGAGGAVCGSGDVLRISEYAGFYALPVVGSDVKRGCPSPSGVVQFSLLSGRLDDGVWAEQVATLEQGETPQFLNLRAAMSSIPNWLGAPGNVEGGSLLRWTGPRTSLATAVAALPFSVGAVYQLDPVSGVFIEATSSADAPLAAGDLVLARFR